MSNKTNAALTLLLALSFWSTTAASGVSAIQYSNSSGENVASAKELQRPSGNDELPTSQRLSQRNRATSVIKCWQYGRLIFDEHDWKIAGPGTSGRLLYSDSGHYSKLQLLQFGDTFCTLKHGGR